MQARRLLLAACVALSTTSLFAQQDAVDKIIDMGKTDNRVMHQLDILSNRFGGRLIGSDAYENAAAWMVREFTNWGLDVELEEAGTLPVGFNRGPWFGKLLSEEGMVLHFATPSYTSGTKGKQRGHVLHEPQSSAEFEAMKGALKGAWVLVSGNNTGWPVNRTPSADKLRQESIEEHDEIMAENREIAMSNRANGEHKEMKTIEPVPYLFYKEMVEAGVLGFIQRADLPIRALYDRPAFQEPDFDFNFDTLPTVPDIKLDKYQYDKIASMVTDRRYPILEFDIRNHFKLGPIKYHNVVASIKGSEFPDEYVIVSGHLDAFDVATGGVDCGTGIGPMMEAARMIAASGAKPKRTILFVGFAGEEFGLLGAKAFCETHKDILPKISYIFNRDGGPLAPVGIQVPKAMYDDFVEITEPIKDLDPEMPFEVTVVKPSPRPTKAGGTDASVFAMNGVPARALTDKDIKGYNFSYQEIWHTENDLYNKHFPDYQEHAATVIAVVSLGVANLDEQLSRKGLYSSK